MLRLIRKAFIESQFSYCPLVWMFHSRTLNNRIWLTAYMNGIYALSIRITNLSLMNFYTRTIPLVSIIGLTKACYGNVQSLYDLSPSLVKSILPTREIPYNLGNCNPFKSTNIHTVCKETETISFRGPKIWSLVPDNLKHAKSLSEFKTKIRDWEPVVAHAGYAELLYLTQVFYELLYFFSQLRTPRDKSLPVITLPRLIISTFYLSTLPTGLATIKIHNLKLCVLVDPPRNVDLGPYYSAYLWSVDVNCLYICLNRFAHMYLF